MAKKTIIVDHSPCARPAGAPVPGKAPKTLAEWAALRQRPVAELQELGFSLWDEEEDVLMLVPGEWFKALPKGLELESISGRKIVVGKDRLGKDIRLGALAYGIRVSSTN